MRHKGLLSTAIIAIGGMICVAGAHAEDLRYVIQDETPAYAGQLDLTFYIDTDSLITAFDPHDDTFDLPAVSTSYLFGLPTHATSVTFAGPDAPSDIYYFPYDSGNGLFINGPVPGDPGSYYSEKFVSSSPLFTGSVFDPTLSTGVFNITSDEIAPDAPQALLTVTEVPDIPISGAPEPSVWALMIVGVGMIGTMFRTGRRQRSVQAS